MEKQRILGLVGGISKNSINQKLFDFFKGLAEDRMDIVQFDIKTLPFYCQDIEYNPPAEVKSLKDMIKSSDGLLIVTPEYNRSFPGVLKNALDWGSRPSGENSWNRMPAGVIGTSPGAIGTFGAQSQLRQVLNLLNVRTMNQPEFYLSFPKELPDNRLPEPSLAFLRKYVDAFCDWIRSNKS
ncbi:MAG: NAD(P)H-dependent oxidoreductase [Synergistaceae bacterium]|jgi:chromate reductase|nr:NAD(P)H-dependent oxidoreductase [Synergistaceae bacterium]